LISDDRCPIRPAPDDDEIRSLTDAQVDEVRKRQKASVGQEAEWSRIFVLLFPNHTGIPSPR
jgi:hypothetical protein